MDYNDKKEAIIRKFDALAARPQFWRERKKREA